MNLQFSCSIFMQGKGTPNGRLRERAGRGDMLDAVWGTSERALGRDYGRRWNLLGGCWPESGSCSSKPIAADPGGCGGFAEILSLLWLRCGAGGAAPGGGKGEGSRFWRSITAPGPRLKPLSMY